MERKDWTTEGTEILMKLRFSLGSSEVSGTISSLYKIKISDGFYTVFSKYGEIIEIW